MSKSNREIFLEMISVEREIQQQQWGGSEHDKTHSPEDWALLLVKHVGKLADGTLEGNAFSDEYHRRLGIIAALCCAAFEVTF